jgi:hypothetical protein
MEVHFGFLKEMEEQWMSKGKRVEEEMERLEVLKCEEGVEISGVEGGMVVGKEGDAIGL